MNERSNGENGLFITLEGDDGVGKSTQADLLTARLEALGHTVVRVHEPGGTKLGEEIRSLLLSRDQDGMTPLAELLLYEAARSQVMAEVIDPALARGDVVICDRFTDSTLAYQGYGRELGPELVSSINMLACGGRSPVRTLLLTLDPAVAASRVIERSTDGAGDRMEMAGTAFHERTREGFACIAHEDPERVHIIDADGSAEQVHARICADLASIIEGLDVREGDIA